MKATCLDSLFGVTVWEIRASGIIGWRKNERARGFFDLWVQHYVDQETVNGPGAWDQRSMGAALWWSDVTLTISRYVAIIRMCGLVKMVHGRGKDVNMI